MLPKKILPVVLVLVAAAGVGTLIYGTTRPSEPYPPLVLTSSPLPVPVVEGVEPPVVEEGPEEFVIHFRDREVGEMIHLPQQLALQPAPLPPGLSEPDFAPSQRQLVGVRPITNRERDGEFLNPRWSPDGLQVILSRPAFQGVYVANADGSGVRKISDANGFSARWDDDGTITVVDEYGMRLRYASDGTLLESVPHRPGEQRVFAENDTIFVRREDGSRFPLTTATDRFFAPLISPDGEYALFQGLTTGVYKVRLDGTEPPIFVGQGNHPQWLPDGSGFVYDRTSDDGHHLIAGEVLFVDRNLRERATLTRGNGRINQMPAVGPGNVISFEAEGEIFVGRLQ